MIVPFPPAHFDAPVDPIRERPAARLCADGFPADCVGAMSPGRVVSSPQRGRTWDGTVRSDGFLTVNIRCKECKESDHRILDVNIVH